MTDITLDINTIFPAYTGFKFYDTITEQILVGISIFGAIATEIIGSASIYARIE